MTDLKVALPLLLSPAIRWAERESALALSAGTPLSAVETALAVKTGVSRPERVRVLCIEALPQPDDALLRAAAAEAGLLDERSSGLTLGYAIFMRREAASRSTLAHELRHVAQHESSGGLAAFLAIYLSQIGDFGYARAPLEEDARAFENA